MGHQPELLKFSSGQWLSAVQMCQPLGSSWSCIPRPCRERRACSLTTVQETHAHARTHALTRSRAHALALACAYAHAYARIPASAPARRARTAACCCELLHQPAAAFSHLAHELDASLFQPPPQVAEPRIRPRPSWLARLRGCGSRAKSAEMATNGVHAGTLLLLTALHVMTAPATSAALPAGTTSRGRAAGPLAAFAPGLGQARSLPLAARRVCPLAVSRPAFGERACLAAARPDHPLVCARVHPAAPWSCGRCILAHCRAPPRSLALFLSAQFCSACTPLLRCVSSGLSSTDAPAQMRRAPPDSLASVHPHLLRGEQRHKGWCCAVTWTLLFSARPSRPWVHHCNAHRLHAGMRTCARARTQRRRARRRFTHPCLSW